MTDDNEYSKYSIPVRGAKTVLMHCKVSGKRAVQCIDHVELYAGNVCLSYIPNDLLEQGGNDSEGHVALPFFGSKPYYNHLVAAESKVIFYMKDGGDVPTLVLEDCSNVSDPDGPFDVVVCTKNGPARHIMVYVGGLCGYMAQSTPSEYVCASDNLPSQIASTAADAGPQTNAV
jgi:hypothetical protein